MYKNHTVSYKFLQEQQQNSTRFPVFPGVVDILLLLFNSVHARPKKLISGDCYTISHLISSDLKSISTSYHDFYCCIFSGKKRSCISGNCYVECKLYIYLLTFDTLCIQKTSYKLKICLANRIRILVTRMDE